VSTRSTRQTAGNAVLSARVLVSVWVLSQ